MKHSLHFLVLILILSGCAEVVTVNWKAHGLPQHTKWFEHDLLTNRQIRSDLESRTNFTQIVQEGEESFDFLLYGNDQGTVIHNRLPYARYWQLEDQEAYVYHPMVLGRYLVEHGHSLLGDSLGRKLVRELAHDDGQGGLAFYYPEHYPLNRMMGPDITYSAISQSEIMAGYSAVADSSFELQNDRERVRNALLRDYYDGGVNLADMAFLEIPLRRSAPEIVLNGWLHALLQLNDYARIHDDEEASRIVKSNVHFLAEHIDEWYADSLNISCYSNTSPYQIKLEFDQYFSGKEGLEIKYDTRVDGLKNQGVPLEFKPGIEFGAHDNHIRSVKGNAVKAFVNITSLFDTYVVANHPFSLEINTGNFDLKRSAPNNEGETLLLKSAQDGEHHYVDLSQIRERLFCGYPTNFSKEDGQNYYHVQHLVTLLLVANYAESADSADCLIIAQKAGEWYAKTLDFKLADIHQFESPQKVLSSINQGKVIVDNDDFLNLLEVSGIEFVW